MKFRLNIRHKFIIVFAPLPVIILVFGIFGIRSFFSINQIFLNLKQNIAPSAFAAMEFKEVLVSLDAAINARVIKRDEIEGQITRLKDLVKRYVPLDEVSLDSTAKEDEEMRLRAFRLMSLARYILNLTENNWQEGEIVRLHASIHQEQVELATILDQKLFNHLQDLSGSEKNISDKYRLAGVIIWCAVIAGMFGALFMVFYMARTVLIPIKMLREGVRQIGNGRLDYSIVVKTGDEFEELAEEFKSMANKLSESYAELDRKVLTRTQELSQANSELKKEIRERVQAEEEQKKAQAQVHSLTQELINVQEIERKRIALDLHDNVAQELSAMKVMSETLCAEPLMDQAQMQKRMREWTEVLNQCVGTIRELSYNLMPPGLEHLGIKSALSYYCREFSKKNGIPVDFTSAGMDRLSLSLDYDIAINIYRIVQEALNNIKKHAGASLAKVRLVASGPNLMLQIEDDGKGCDLGEAHAVALSSKRLGLLGMQERVKLLDGSLKIYSRPQEGMKLFIEIPWEKSNGGEEYDTSY